MRVGIGPFVVLVSWTLAHAAGQEQPIVRVEPSEVLIEPGEEAEVEIAVTVAPGFHVQANPAANEFLIPVTVEIEDREGIGAGEPSYPPPERYRLQGSEEDLLVYGGTFTVTVPIEAERSLSSEELALEGTLRYQACDDRSCRAPASAPFTLTVKTKPDSAK